MRISISVDVDEVIHNCMYTYKYISMVTWFISDKSGKNIYKYGSMAHICHDYISPFISWITWPISDKL